jgi:serine protease Do
VTIQPVTPELKEKLRLKDEKGALVSDVTSGGPADKSGIRRGDVIILFDGREIKESNNLPYMAAKTPVDKVVAVEVMRKGEKKGLQLKIGELKEEQAPREKTGKPEKGLRFGMRVEQLTPEIAGYFGLSETTSLVVVELADEGPAAEAGLQPGDLIIEVDQVPVNEVREFDRKIYSYKAGDTVLLLVKRQGAALYLTLKVGK